MQAIHASYNKGALTQTQVRSFKQTVIKIYLNDEARINQRKILLDFDVFWKIRKSMQKY